MTKEKLKKALKHVEKANALLWEIEEGKYLTSTTERLITQIKGKL